VSRIDRPADPDRYPERPELSGAGASWASTDSKGARLDGIDDRVTPPEPRSESRPGADAGRDAVLPAKAGSLDRERDAETPGDGRGDRSAGDGWDAFWNYDGRCSVAELRTAKIIHDLNPGKVARLRALSDDELIRSFDSPRDGGFVQMIPEPDGRIMNGNHRVAELLRRADDPRSKITEATRVRIDRYNTDNGVYFWDWGS